MRSFLIHGNHDAPFVIRLPDDSGGLDQDKEWFEVELGGRRKRLRVQDYGALYEIPGLYEALVYGALKCRSPGRLVDLLAAVLEDWTTEPGDLRVLDLGAGNGVVADHLRKAGVRHIVGLDLLPEAAMAAQRDRPGAYDDFVVADLEDLDPADERRLRRHSLNCLITVAALGFGDVPPMAFATAYNLIADGGWMAMTIKEEFLDSDDGGGFGRLIRRMIHHRFIELHAHHRYCHRLSIAGEKLSYIALVARKLRPIPRLITLRPEVPTAVSAGTANHVPVFLRT